MWDVISKTQVYLVTEASLPEGLGWIPTGVELTEATDRVYAHSTPYMQVTSRKPRENRFLQSRSSSVATTVEWKSRFQDYHRHGNGRYTTIVDFVSLWHAW